MQRSPDKLRHSTFPMRALPARSARPEVPDDARMLLTRVARITKVEFGTKKFRSSRKGMTGLVSTYPHWTEYSAEVGVILAENSRFSGDFCDFLPVRKKESASI